MSESGSLRSMVTRVRRLAIPSLLLLGASACSASGGASRGGSGTATGGSGGQQEGGAGGSSGATSTGGAKVGDACKTDSDCSDPPGAKCFTTVGDPQFGTVTFPGGYCSKDCSGTGDGGTDCGASGGCTDFGTSSGGKTITLTMCTAPCKTDSDCRTADGYHCNILIPGLGGYCGP